MPRVRHNARNGAGSSATVRPGRRFRLNAIAELGANIELEQAALINFNCVVLDVCRVRIGDFTLFTASRSTRRCIRSMPTCGAAKNSGNRSTSDPTSGSAAAR